MKENRYKRSFASDNNAITHPKIMDALNSVNTGHCISYGEDSITESAKIRFKEIFGADTETFFVFNGTGANVLSIAATGHPYHAVVCSDTAHINLDECGAPERFSGCKLLPLKSDDGKINIDGIKKTLSVIGCEHHSQPGIISITQATELGTVYNLDEIKSITSFAHQNNMPVYMDGARIANAAAYLHVSLKSMTTDAGVDVLSFGGTKNGLMFGEAVVFLNKDIAQDFMYIRKQGMQLASKMRYIAAQFLRLFEDDLWLKNARQANSMAQLLADKVSLIPGIKLTRPVQANGVFALMPKDAANRLIKEYYFYYMNEEIGELRWMTSFDTEKEDVDAFVKAIYQSIKD